MQISKLTIVIISLIAVAGCVGPRSDSAKGGSSASELTSAAAQTTRSSLPDQPFNNAERADKLLGQDVVTSDHQKAGKIVNFVVDQTSGEILYAIVGFGGVLGVGETRVAVPPALFTEAKRGAIELSIDKHKLTAAPQATQDMTKETKTDFVKNVYGYYGLTPASASARTTEPAKTGVVATTRTVSELQGAKVINNNHQDIGKVQTVVLDVPKGRELYVVLSPSAGLNLGKNYYALPPAALSFSADGKTLVADLTREKLANAPHFANDDWSELSDAAWARKVYQYYGQTETFQGGELQPTGRTAPGASDPLKR